MLAQVLNTGVPVCVVLTFTDELNRRQGALDLEAFGRAVGVPVVAVVSGRMAVEQVIAGDVGDFVRGHGGRISLVGVDDGRVEVALGGACSHCPASELTLTERFEVVVRARCPEVREIVARDEPGQVGLTGGPRLLGILPGRR